MEPTNVLLDNTFAQKRKGQLTAEKIKENLCRMLLFCATQVSKEDNEDTYKALQKYSGDIMFFYQNHGEPFPEALWYDVPLAHEMLVLFIVYEARESFRTSPNVPMERLLAATKRTPALAVVAFLNEFERVTGVPFANLFGSSRSMDKELLMVRQKARFGEDDPEYGD